MNLRTLIMGANASFIRAGTSDPDEDPAVLVSATHKPEDDESELYLSLGVVESAVVTPKVEKLRLKAPSPGRYRLRKTIPLSQELEIRMTMQDFSQLAFESLFQIDGALTVGAAKQPMEQTESITGWLKLILADQTDTTTGELFLWVEISINPINVGERQYSYEWVVDVLENPLATFTLAALTNN